MTTEQSIEEAKFWDTFGWANVTEPENRNMDTVPSGFHIDFVCPVCGSAWGELDALGFQAPKVHSGAVSWFGALPVILPDAPRIEIFIRGIRIVCLEDHVIEYDRVTKRHRQHTTLIGTGTMSELIVGTMALWSSFSFFQKLKGR